MLKFFRIVTLLEGLSFLFLLLVSMPLKYNNVTAVPNQIGGMFHGALFILYVLMIVPMGRKFGWSFKTMFVIGLGSLIPFGTFYVDHKYLKPER